MALKIPVDQPFYGYVFLGSRSESVKRLQQRFNEMRAQYAQLKATDVLEVDGAFGMATHRAVLKVQGYSKLKADGIVGPMTAVAFGFSNYVQRQVPYVPPRLVSPPRPVVPGEAPLPPAPQPKERNPLTDVGLLASDAVRNLIDFVVRSLMPVIDAAEDELKEGLKRMAGRLRKAAASFCATLIACFDVTTSVAIERVRDMFRGCFARLRGDINLIFTEAQSLGLIVGTALDTVVKRALLEAIGIIEEQTMQALIGLAAVGQLAWAVLSPLYASQVRAIAYILEKLA